MENYKIALILGICLTLFGCTKPTVISANLEKVIVTKNIENASIFFVVNFRNNSDEEKYLFANSFLKTNTYKNCGIILNYNNIVTPIGAYIPENSTEIKLRKNSDSKIIFSYSKKYPNKWVDYIIKDSEIDYELTKIAKSATFHYELNDNNFNPKLAKETFIISKKNTIIEHKDELSIEEAVRILNN